MQPRPRASPVRFSSPTRVSRSPCPDPRTLAAAAADKSLVRDPSRNTQFFTSAVRASSDRHATPRPVSHRIRRVPQAPVNSSESNPPSTSIATTERRSSQARLYIPSQLCELRAERDRKSHTFRPRRLARKPGGLREGDAPVCGRDGELVAVADSGDGGHRPP